MMKYGFLTLAILGVQLAAWSQLSRQDQKRADEVYGATEELMRSNWKEVPEQYANQSAVVLEYIQIDDYEKKTGGSKVTNMVRVATIIKDKSALEDYSTINLSAVLGPGAAMRRKEGDYLRIHKPSGQVDVVDLGKLERNANGEVAIPGLEIGDIVDFAFYAEALIPTIPMCEEDEIVRLNRKYPIVHGQHRLCANLDFSVNFRWFNDREPFVQNEAASRSSHRCYDMSFEHIAPASKEPLSPSLLNTDTYHYTLCPKAGVTLGHQVTAGYRDISTSIDLPVWEKMAKTEGRALASAKVNDGNTKLFGRWMKVNYGKAKLKPEELMEATHNFLRYYLLIFDQMAGKYRDDYQSRYITPNYQRRFMATVAKQYKIPFEAVIVPSRYRGNMDNVVSTAETTVLMRFKNSQGEWQYVYPFYAFDTFGRSHESYEGQKGVAGTMKTAALTEPIPATSHKDNVLEYRFVLTPEFDEGLVAVEMTTSAIGIFKHDFSRSILQSIAFHEDVEDYLIDGVKRDQILDQGRIARGRSSSADRVDDDMDEKMSQMRKRRENLFDLKDYTHFSVSNTGVRNNADSLVYREKMTVQNALSKVGNNYILDLGKLMLEQLVIDENNLSNRQTDIVPDFAKTYKYRYTLPIPAGYDLEGADGIQAKAENEFGKIDISTSSEGGKLHVIIEKAYKVNYAKAADWPKFLEFLVPAMEINDKKLVYKKVA